MSDIDHLIQQLNQASAEIVQRRLRVQQHRAYLALLKTLNVGTWLQTNELLMLEGELDRWEELHRRISELVMFHLKPVPDLSALSKRNR